MDNMQIFKALSKWKDKLPAWRLVTSPSECTRRNVIYVVNWGNVHWTVFSAFDGESEYFDSFGTGRAEEIVDVMPLVDTAADLQVVTTRLQGKEDGNCGEWILLYIFARWVLHRTLGQFVDKLRGADARKIAVIFSDVFGGTTHTRLLYI